MISHEDFLKLGRGDVVLYNGRFRFVQEGPRNMSNTKHGSIVFAIKRRSWTRRAVTTIGYHDVKHNISILKRPPSERLVRRVRNSECQKLRDLGFEPFSQLKSEIKEAKRINKHPSLNRHLLLETTEIN